MKEIIVLNRENASKYSFNTNIKPCIIISINTDGETNKFADNDNIKAVGYWTFDDVEDGNKAMTEMQANDITLFVNRWINRVNTIIVHCDGGVSRSAGIGAALMKWANGDDSPIFDNGKYCPNMHCFRLMLNALMVYMSDTDIEDRNSRNIKAWRKEHDFD